MVTRKPTKQKTKQNRTKSLAVFLCFFSFNENCQFQWFSFFAFSGLMKIIFKKKKEKKKDFCHKKMNFTYTSFVLGTLIIIKRKKRREIGVIFGVFPFGLGKNSDDRISIYTYWRHSPKTKNESKIIGLDKAKKCHKEFFLLTKMMTHIRNMVVLHIFIDKKKFSNRISSLMLLK